MRLARMVVSPRSECGPRAAPSPRSRRQRPFLPAGRGLAAGEVRSVTHATGRLKRKRRPSRRALPVQSHVRPGERTVSVDVRAQQVSQTRFRIRADGVGKRQRRRACPTVSGHVGKPVFRNTDVEGQREALGSEALEPLPDARRIGHRETAEHDPVGDLERRLEAVVIANTAAQLDPRCTGRTHLRDQIQIHRTARRRSIQIHDVQPFGT